MSDRHSTLFGTYPTRDQADAAIGTLRTNGFRSSDASVLFPFVATTAATRAGEAVGGPIGALIGLGIPDDLVRRYEGQMRKGRILLSVHADDQAWASIGEQILVQTGAEDICSTVEIRGLARRFRSAPVEHSTVVNDYPGTLAGSTRFSSR
jgi:hypothetical protein